MIALLSIALASVITAPSGVPGSIQSLPSGYITQHTYTVKTCKPDWKPWDWDHQQCTTRTILQLPDGTQVVVPRMRASVAGYACAVEGVPAGSEGCPNTATAWWQRVLVGLGI